MWSYSGFPPFYSIIELRESHITILHGRCNYSVAACLVCFYESLITQTFLLSRLADIVSDYSLYVLLPLIFLILKILCIAFDSWFLGVIEVFSGYQFHYIYFLHMLYMIGVLCIWFLLKKLASVLPISFGSTEFSAYSAFMRVLFPFSNTSIQCHLSR